MHIHIIGICGTFMAGIAVIAKQLGYVVSGSDKNFYSPMSDILVQNNITTYTGYDKLYVSDADIVIIGNQLSRGVAVIEDILNKNIPYISGPQWLSENVLFDKLVIAIAGTHGKTTTSSMLHWILTQNNLDIGYLIGGSCSHLNKSAAIGSSKYFVIEADEYDSSFFDKRSKFIHYKAKTLLINNIEYDHADIFANINDIKKQFSYLLRNVPSSGCIVYDKNDKNVNDVVAAGCWSKSTTINLTGVLDNKSEWQAVLNTSCGNSFAVYHKGELVDNIHWGLIGKHNVHNALASIACSCTVGIKPIEAVRAIKSFPGVKRRLEKVAAIDNMIIYDDFAHHPTAISSTLAGLRAQVGLDKQIIAVIELASNTMSLGSHSNGLNTAVNDANVVIWYTKNPIASNYQDILIQNKQHSIAADLTDILETINKYLLPSANIVVMSNSDSKHIYTPIVSLLQNKG